jgi:hypothetical protein
MAPVVYLHIGSPKTGTTYVQDVLWNNREALETDGVLLPGHYRYARVQAVRELLKWNPDEGEQPESWPRLAGEVNRWGGRSAVISQEFLCWATDEQIKIVVDSFPESTVRVVLTVRDVARLVPAQWQTAMRQRNTWTLDEYADGVAGTGSGKRGQRLTRHFWRRHDYGPILQRWVDAVGVDNVCVVTLPTSGSDPEELWRRVCSAIDIDPATTTPGEASHESLGAASAELMRRLNELPEVKELTMQEYHKSVNGALSRRVLGKRRSREQSLTLPEEHREWAERESDRVINDIGAVGVRVIGDLEDLRPRASSADAVAPEELPAAELLAAALDGLAGMATEHAALVKKLKKREDRPRGRKKQVSEPLQRGGFAELRRVWRRRRQR